MHYTSIFKIQINFIQKKLIMITQNCFASRKVTFCILQKDQLFQHYRKIQQPTRGFESTKCNKTINQNFHYLRSQRGFNLQVNAGRQPESGSGGLSFLKNWSYLVLALLLALVVFRQRAVLAILVVALVVLQTPTDNFLLNQFADSGLFTGYGEAKKFLNVLTVTSIAMFMLVSIVMSKA
eukprot:TRINITY_DN18123_c0_g1_i4.p2 TRINITY_DN18123_c0_g1~~TRINITY_DN18123_c0_g1_i4.p2  ORF type:complete len:180 (-),score=4.91 TRINITY_DN18123_c0_g1_i4:832-1371(-)